MNRIWLLGWAFFLSFLIVPDATGDPKKSPDEKTPTKSTHSPSTTSHHIVSPPMLSPPSPYLPYGQIHIKMKLVYAHTRPHPHTDAPLRGDIPELKHMYGFNAYQLLHTFDQKLTYGQVLKIRISHRYQVNIHPKGYDLRSKMIALKANFLYRKTSKGSPSPMSSYASTDLRIKSGSKVAFVGPEHRDGRALLICSAQLTNTLP